MTIVKLDDVSKKYSGVTVLNNVSISIDEGEFYGLIGINGAGKTTLINTLTGKVEPTNGSINVLGMNPVKKGSQIREKIGILPEKESPLDFMTVEEYFYFIGNVRGINEDKLHKKIDYWCDKLELENQRDLLNKNLSRGQKQKVLFASIFIHEPKLVLIDEPLANLDPIIQEKIKSYLIDYNKKGNTVIFSTHHLNVARELCSKIGVMRNGNLTGEYNISDIESNNEIIELLGDSNE